jgi:hypothetical protein
MISTLFGFDDLPTVKLPSFAVGYQFNNIVRSNEPPFAHFHQCPFPLHSARCSTTPTMPGTQSPASTVITKGFVSGQAAPKFNPIALPAIIPPLPIGAPNGPTTAPQSHTGQAGAEAIPTIIVPPIRAETDINQCPSLTMPTVNQGKIRDYASAIAQEIDECKRLHLYALLYKKLFFWERWRFNDFFEDLQVFLQNLSTTCTVLQGHFYDVATNFLGEKQVYSIPSKSELTKLSKKCTTLSNAATKVKRTITDALGEHAFRNLFTSLEKLLQGFERGLQEVRDLETTHANYQVPHDDPHADANSPSIAVIDLTAGPSVAGDHASSDTDSSAGDPDAFPAAFASRTHQASDQQPAARHRLDGAPTLRDKYVGPITRLVGTEDSALVELCGPLKRAVQALKTFTAKHNKANTQQCATGLSLFFKELSEAALVLRDVSVNVPLLN